MRHLLLALTALTLPSAAFAQTAPAAATSAPMPVAPKPAALEADGIPAVPMSLVEATRPYMEFRTAGFVDWDPVSKSMLISTRFGNVAQLHTVKGPGMARTQISFEPEPLRGGYLPGDGTMIVQKDKGGDLDWFSPAGMVKPFSDAATKLQKGLYTTVPVQTQFGWHVIKLDDVRTAQPPAYDKVKEGLQKQIQQRNLDKYLADLRAKAKITN